MRPFHFRLKPLQRLREQTRDAAQRDLAEARARAAQLQRQEADLKNELQGLEEHMRGAVNKNELDIDRVMDGHRHQLSLQARLAELDKAMTEARQQVEECRTKLVAADRQVKVLEKLHERQLAAHQRRMAQAEAKQLDEIANVRAARSRSTSS